jgi:adenylate cyclase
VKGKIWLSQIPIALIFTAFFWVHEKAVNGELASTFLREKIYPALQSIHGQHTNLKFKMRGIEQPQNKIVIVEIDSDSIAQFGRWPWHRDLTASLIQSTFDAGAKAVGLDMVFSEPDRRVSEELATVLKEKGLGSMIDHFETDQNLRDVIAFNQDRLTLGWTHEVACQPRFDSADACADLTSPELKDSLKSFARLSVRDVSFDGKTNIGDTPLPVAIQVLNNYELFQNETQSSGSFYAVQDSDGTIRRSPLLFLDPNGNYYPSLPFELARRALQEDIKISSRSDFTIRSLEFKKSGRSIPVSPLGLMEINFRGPAQTFQYLRAMEVMNSSDEVRIQTGRTIANASKKELLKDAIVLIGVSALGVFDMRSFPFDSNVPGVEGHANILDNLLSGDMFSRSSSGATLFCIYLLLTFGALFFAFSVERLEAIPALLVMVFFFAGGALADQKLLFENQINLNTSLILLEYSVMFIFILCVKYVMEERNKKFIKGAFSKYVSPAIIDSILEDPTKLTLGGEKKELTILFSDIRSFTTFSEKMDAKVLAQFLNEYLGKMTDIVFETSGTLDKYIGDAVMAFWGAPLDQPQHAALACEAAIRMHRKLDELRPVLMERYGVDVQIGIGINSGAVNVGNMGSENVFEYTVIGDHVNLASRLEGLTKEYHAKILTTRFTLDCIAEAKGTTPPYRILDLVKVKGKKKAIELIEVREVETPPIALETFEKARQHYLKREWHEAITAFKESAELLKNPAGEQDSMSQVFIERCEYFMEKAPDDDWDGAWVMTTK